MSSIVYLLPVIIILIGALVLMFMSMYNFKTMTFIGMSTIFLVIALVISFYHIDDLFAFNPFGNLFKNMLIFDSFSNFFSILLIIGALLIVLVGESYAKTRAYIKGEFYAMILFSLFGMMLLAHANELITAYISLEIASFSIYILVGFNTANNRRVEAVFKYLILGSFIGSFFLLGTALIYGATGTTNLNEIGFFISNSDSSLALVYIGITMILFTFLFKIAAFPFQSWVIDVYRGSSVLVTAYMASVFKIAIFSFFLRAYIQDFASLQHYWVPILEVLTVLTLAIGTWLALIQKNVKRMLAASSIVHTGYLLLAFIALGTNIASAYSIVFYLIAYLLTAIGAFGLISHIIAETKVRVTFDDFKGLAQERPYLAALMTIFMMSFAGIPTTIGFMGKFYVFVEAIHAGYIWLVVIAVLATIVSVYYYFKLIAMMYFYPSTNNIKPYFNDRTISTYAIGFLAILIIWSGVGSAIAFFIPIPNIDQIIAVVQLSIKSLFLH